MKDEKKGRRQAENTSAFSRWRAERREWLANMTRGQRIRHRILQGAVMVSAVIVALWVILTLWIQPPELPGNPVIRPGGLGAVSSSTPVEDWEVEGPDIAQSGRKEGVYTFLVAGLDVASGATDTMLLLSFDTNEKVIRGLNLPRDTIMNVSYNSKRLNTIYTINKGKDKATQVENGMRALGTHVAKLTGITPDFYVLLEWEAIGELVDALGGVEFNVPFDMDYDDPYQDLHIHQKAGLRVLSGDDAMQVIRHRKNNDGSHSAGDVGRLSIQQDFLKAVVKKCLQPSIFLKVPALAEIFVENVKTDLSIGNILAFAKMAVGMDPTTGVSFQTAPLAADAWYGTALMVTLDGEGILKIVNNGMNPYLRDITMNDLELIYKKADGSYGVTRGQLADPKMGVVKVVEKPVEKEPEVQEPVEPEVPVEDPSVIPENPGVTDPSGSTQDTPSSSEGQTPGGSETGDPSQGAPQTGEDPQVDPSQSEPAGSQPSVEQPAQSQPESPEHSEEIPEHMVPVIP